MYTYIRVTKRLYHFRKRFSNILLTFFCSFFTYLGRIFLYFVGWGHVVCTLIKVSFTFAIFTLLLFDRFADWKYWTKTYSPSKIHWSRNRSSIFLNRRNRYFLLDVIFMKAVVFTIYMTVLWNETHNNFILIHSLMITTWKAQFKTLLDSSYGSVTTIYHTSLSDRRYVLFKKFTGILNWDRFVKSHFLMRPQISLKSCWFFSNLHV